MADNHKAEFFDWSNSKGLKRALVEKLIKSKTHQAENIAEKWVRSYFLIQTVIGLFECEKRHICCLFLKGRKPFKPFFQTFQFFGHMVLAFCDFDLPYRAHKFINSEKMVQNRDLGVICWGLLCPRDRILWFDKSYPTIY